MKIKRFLSLLTAVIMTVSLLPVCTADAETDGIIFEEESAELESVQSGTCGENLTWVLDDDGTLTISGTGDMTDWGVAPWDYYKSSIKSAIINNGVTSIGNSAFHSCDSLTSVTIPNSVTSIGGFAFYGCDSLTSVTIPNSVTSIGVCAFFWCDSLTSVTIPTSVTSIGNSAFHSCDSLTKIEVSADNKSYTSVDGVLFNKDKSEIICYPAEKPGASYTIPTSVKSIGEKTFFNCDSLTSVTIPTSVKSIGEFAFYSCDSLTSVTIPNSVTSIGEKTFCSCDRLASVTIPTSVTSIGDSAFGYCYSLTDVYYSGTKAEWESINILDGNEPLLNANIHYQSKMPESPAESTPIPTTEPNPSGDCGENLTWELDGEKLVIKGKGNMTDWKNSDDIPWNKYGKDISEIIIDDGITSIGDYSFSGFTSLKSVTIPDSVTEMGRGIFAECNNLQKIKVPFIGANTNPGMTEITPEGVLGYLFGEGEGIVQGDISYAIPESLAKVEVTLPDRDSYIPMGAFANCANICDIIIDGGNAVLDGAFANCVNLKNVYIPKSVSSFGKAIFENCTNIETMTVPFVGSNRSDNNSETSVFGAFFGTSGESTGEDGIQQYYAEDKSMWYHMPKTLKNVTVLNNTDIPYGAFMGCDSIEQVSIVTGAVINERAFYGCKSLKNVLLPNNMREIKYEAFAYCESIESINIPKNAKFIDEYAFRGAERFRRILIPRSVEYIAKSAFAATPFMPDFAESAGLMNTDTDAVIICAENSYAAQYAEDNNIRSTTVDEEKLDIKRTMTTTGKHSDGAYFFDIIDKNGLSGNLFVALYDENGNMVNVKKLDADSSENNVEYRIEFTGEEMRGADKAKIFIWGGLNKMTPVTSIAEEKNLN